MTILVWTDNASSLLASGILSTDLTLTVTTGEGALFPAISAGQAAVVTLEDTSGNIEQVLCTGRTGDTLTIVRGQYGTTAAAFASGSRVEIRATAASLQAMLQKGGGDTLAGTTTLTGVIDMGSSGSVQGGEFAGGYVRSAAGVTAGQISVQAGVPKSGSDTILTQANIAANMPSGYALMQTGMICIWYGSLGSIPAGWQACDGTSGTPDLRDKFVLGAGGALPSSGGDTSTSVDSAGAITVASYTLTEADIPAHTHRYFADPATGTFSGGGSGIGLSFANTPTYLTNVPSGAHGAGTQFIESTGGGGGHTHTATQGTHSHTCLPPYTALFYIMKT